MQSSGVDPKLLTTHYEAARALAVGDSWRGHPVIGLTLLYRCGLPAWMEHVQNTPRHLDLVTGPRAARSTTSAPGADVAAAILIIASMLLASSKEPSQCMPRSN